MYGIGGKVVDGAGNGMDGVTISFSHEYTSVTTNTDGTWSKNGLDPFDGPITVTASSTNEVFSPGSFTVTGTKNDIYFVYVNRVGFEEGTCFYGGSMLVDPSGTIACKLPFIEEKIDYASINLDTIRKKIRSFPLHFDRKDNLIGKLFLEDENENK